MAETDLISRQAAIDALAGMIDRFERILADIRETKVDDSVCGMCEYDGAYIGQSGDWCNECPGFDKDNCFKLSDRCRKRWMSDITLPPAQPERKKPVFKTGESVYHVSYADGTGGFEKNKWADWTCPDCGWFVGEQYIPRRHNQQKCNYCARCGCAIDWSDADMGGEQDETD